MTESQTVTRFHCPKCTKIFSTWKNLGRHCIAQHQWSVSKGAPLITKPAPSAKSEKGKMADVEPDDGDGVEASATAPGPSKDVDEAIRNQLATEGIAITRQEPAETPGEASTSHDLTAKEKVYKSWDTAIDPTARKKARTAKVFCPARDSQSGKGSVLTDPFGTLECKQQTAKWPNRALCPPIRDIIGYRRSLPDIPPSRIGELARSRFGWGDEKAISSKRYVQGVAAGYDAGRRAVFQKLEEYLRAGPGRNPEPGERLEWIRLWMESNPPPAVSEQEFSD